MAFNYVTIDDDDYFVATNTFNTPSVDQVQLPSRRNPFDVFVEGLEGEQAKAYVALQLANETFLACNNAIADLPVISEKTLGYLRTTLFGEVDTMIIERGLNDRIKKRLYLRFSDSKFIINIQGSLSDLLEQDSELTFRLKQEVQGVLADTIQ